MTDPLANAATCAACRHQIDASARICPFCGADPSTGEKIDTKVILEEVFQPREISTTESVLQYARQRQGLVVILVSLVIFGVLAGLHQFVTARNQSAVSAASAVSLTEVADLSNQPMETEPAKMPDLDFAYDGRPQAMRTFIIEPGAVTPPEIQAAQQAAAAAQQAASAQPAPQQPQAPAPPRSR